MIYEGLLKLPVSLAIVSIAARTWNSGAPENDAEHAAVTVRT
jgi:hypothetical protein